MGNSGSGSFSEGCLQDVVLSPLLWSFFVDSLLRVLNGIGAAKYVDDIAYLARGALRTIYKRTSDDRSVVQG